jgi:hypothetical protein
MEGPAGGPAALNPPHPQPSKAKVIGWINVSSGCQEETVRLLRELAELYRDRVDVEIVDFGQPAGARRWQERGIGCMAIEFDGHTAVAFRKGGRETVAVFQMPAGFSWTHEDLRAAFASLAAGELRPATPQEIADLTAPRLVRLTVRAQAVRDVGGQGREYGQLLINDVVVARVYASYHGQSPAQRCKHAQAALEKWLAHPVLPSDLSVAEGPDGWGLYADEELVLVARPEDARAYGPAVTPKLLAAHWLTNVRPLVAEAVAKARLKEEAEREGAGSASAPAQQPRP